MEASFWFALYAKWKSNECMKIMLLKGNQCTMQYAVLQGTLQSVCRAVSFARTFWCWDVWWCIVMFWVQCKYVCQVCQRTAEWLYECRCSDRDRIVWMIYSALNSTSRLCLYLYVRWCCVEMIVISPLLKWNVTDGNPGCKFSVGGWLDSIRTVKKKTICETTF